MLTEDYIVRMIRDMGQMLARVLGSSRTIPSAPAPVCRGHSRRASAGASRGLSPSEQEKNK